MIKIRQPAPERKVVDLVIQQYAGIAGHDARLTPFLTAFLVLLVPGNYRFVIRCLALLGGLVTLALAVHRRFPWAKVGPYVAAQLAGAFLGAALVFVTYHEALNAFDGGVRHVAGDLGTAAPPELKAICAVSPTMDLAPCVEALERRSNLVYEWNFVRNLKRRMRRKAALFPDLFDLQPLTRVRTVRQFDEAYTAPHHGFADAADYYHRASAMRVIDKVARPSLILSAADDPFVPPEIFDAPPVRNNPHITTVITPKGGHCAFVEPPTSAPTPPAAGSGYDGYFAEQLVVEFLKEKV